MKKVEAELDEAEEIVSPSSSLADHQGSTQVKHSSCDNFSQISQMEIELPSMPLSIRTPYQTRLASSKSDLNKVKKALVSPTFTLSSPSPLNKGSPYNPSSLLGCGLNHLMSRYSYSITRRKTSRENLSAQTYSATQAGNVIRVNRIRLIRMNRGTIGISGAGCWQVPRR